MTLEEIFRAIGDNAVNSIEGSWQVLNLSISRLEKFVSVKGSYKDCNGTTRDIKSSTFGYMFSKKIHELHRITTEGSSNKWNKLEFVVHQDGKFHTDLFGIKTIKMK
jgi:hypothetical protein